MTGTPPAPIPDFDEHQPAASGAQCITWEHWGCAMRVLTPLDGEEYNLVMVREGPSPRQEKTP